MPQIKDIEITKITAGDSDLLVMQNPETGETYKITKANLLAGSSNGGGTPTPTETNFTYVRDGDTHGLFYFLGTQKNTIAWSNPYDNGLIVTASSVSGGSLFQLCDRADGNFYSGNYNNSWVNFRLDSGKLLCNRYSIKSRTDNGYFLRSWKLQGSDDGSTWVDLDVQTNNTTVNSPTTWLTLPVTATVGYSIFRLINTGNDSNGYNYLCLGEVELYGTYSA